MRFMSSLYCSRIQKHGKKLVGIPVTQAKECPRSILWIRWPLVISNQHQWECIDQPHAEEGRKRHGEGGSEMRPRMTSRRTVDQDLRMTGGEGRCAGDVEHHSEVEVFRCCPMFLGRLTENKSSEPTDYQNFTQTIINDSCVTF